MLAVLVASFSSNSKKIVCEACPKDILLNRKSINYQELVDRTEDEC